MKLTYDDICEHQVVPFPLEIQNYFLRILGPDAFNLRAVSNLIDAGDFKSFCKMPEYVACKSHVGDVAIMAVTTAQLKDCKQAEFLTNCDYQLTDTSALHIALIGKTLVVAEVHYSHKVCIERACVLSKEQAIATAQRLIGGFA